MDYSFERVLFFYVDLGFARYSLKMAFSDQFLILFKSKLSTFVQLVIIMKRGLE